MTSNPHPEHGPLWVERDADPSDKRLPHKLRLSDDWLKWLSPTEADAIEAQLTPLPDGVYRERGGFRSVGGNVCCLPPEWQWLSGGDVWVTGDGCPLSDWHRVRRTPAEPPAPPTEDVPWWEALRDERLLPGDLGTRCISTGFVGGRRWVGEGDAVGSYLNPDGTVTVQAQGVES